MSLKFQERMMERIVIGLSLLLVAVPFGYCQESTQRFQLTLKSDKQIYSVDEKMTFLLTIKNLSSQKLQLLGPQGAIELILVILDGKEYKNLGLGPSAWGGPDALFPKSEINVAIDFVKYGITKDVLTLGKHNIAAKLNGTISNTITIKVVGKEEILKEEALKITEKVCEESGWKWIDVSVLEDKDKWTIRTNSHADGSNTFVEIDKKTGAVLRKGFGPR